MTGRVLAVTLLLLSATMAFGQITYVPVSLNYPQIAIGADAGGQNYTTLIQIVNNNSTTTIGHIALFSDSGTALPAQFDGQSPQSTLDVTLNSGATRQIELTLNGTITVGWMQITYTPSDALTTVILQFRSGATLLSEVGVDPTPGTIAATDFAAETDAALNTGIALANPSSASAFVLARLWDPSTGAQTTGQIVTLPAAGHVSKLLTELFPSVLNISQTRAKISLDSCLNSGCNFSGGNGFVATAIRLNGDQFTTIPVADRPSDGDQNRTLPQVAFGGPTTGLNMKTVLYFTTNVSTGVFGTANIFDNDGNPLPASADGAAAASQFTFGVPGNRVTRIVLSGDQTLRSGWIRLTLSSGSVHMLTSAVFQTFNGTNLASEASVLESLAVTGGLVYVKVRSGSANVGVALANPQSSENTVTLTLFNSTGFKAGSRDVKLAANGHAAQFVTELFPDLASATDFDGALSIHSSTAFSALALRLSGDKVATLPVAENAMYRPSIVGLRIKSTQRSPAQVSFEIDLKDFDNDLSITGATSVSAVAVVDFGSSGYDLGSITIDGTSIANRDSGTLSGSFQPPHVTGTVPSGTPAGFLIYVFDAAGNSSNLVGIPFRF